MATRRSRVCPIPGRDVIIPLQRWHTYDQTAFFAVLGCERGFQTVGVGFHGSVHAFEELDESIMGFDLIVRACASYGLA